MLSPPRAQALGDKPFHIYNMSYCNLLPYVVLGTIQLCLYHLRMNEYPDLTAVVALT